MKTTKLLIEDFEFHAYWMDGNRKVSKMWKHKPTRDFFYEDVPEAHEKELKIYPFLDRR